VIASRTKKTVFVVLLVFSFIGLFPVSARLGDPLFTYPFRTGWQYEYPILLVWSDRVEIRWFHNISEVSPRPVGAGYTFNVPLERQAWVESKVRSTPAPNGADAGWIIRVKQLGSSGQRIQLELMGDGITGLLYEVRGDEVIPLKSRLAGPLVVSETHISDTTRATQFIANPDGASSVVGWNLVLCVAVFQVA
jgi:hypothetical protein